jgi:hypothetical protein
VAHHLLINKCDRSPASLEDEHEHGGQQTEHAARIAFFELSSGVVDMKRFAISCAAGAFTLVCASAFAQDNPPSSSTGLQAGDNAQTTTQGPGTHKHKSTHTKKSSSTMSSGQSMQPGGTATPGGPGAPVTASGSGK